MFRGRVEHHGQALVGDKRIHVHVAVDALKTMKCSDVICNFSLGLVCVMITKKSLRLNIDEFNFPISSQRIK